MLASFCFVFQMSVNSLSSHLNSSSSNYTFPDYVQCSFSFPEYIIFNTFFTFKIFVFLPLCIFILHHGFQRWQKNSSALKHFDFFSYHLAALQLIGVFGCFFCFCGFCGDYQQIVLVGYILYSTSCFGETYFHVFLCLEQYLAVVHPITYMSLRKERGMRIRNVSVSCAWALTALGTGLSNVDHMTEVVIFMQEFAAAAVISFCCQSVLCGLIHPGSTIQAKDKVDQSKQRAFYTIIVILGVLMLRLSWGVFWVLLDMIYNKTSCQMVILNAWINVPSNLVIPFLFLQRAGKCVWLIKEDKR